MSFTKQLQAIYQNDAAVEFARILQRIASIWDDLVDGDLVPDNEIHEAFTLALFDLPNNAFYATNRKILEPVLYNGMLNWRIATRIERDRSSSAQLIEQAHVLRYSVADALTLALGLLHGTAAVEEHGATIRALVMTDTLAQYREEHDRE